MSFKQPTDFSSLFNKVDITRILKIKSDRGTSSGGRSPGYSAENKTAQAN